MKTIPMIFNQQMIQALVDGRKTVTRRPMKPEIKDHNFGCFLKSFEVAGEVNNFEYENSAFKPGDLIWVRETFRQFNSSDECGCSDSPCGCPSNGTYIYKSIGDDGESKWKPSIHMPRKASRLTLRVTDVRCERLQQVDKQQAQKEGVHPTGCTKGFWVKAYQMLWDSIYSNWDENPWVWVIEFDVIKSNVDEVINEH